MKHYQQLLKLGCFTREDVAKIVGNTKTADSLLYSYKKGGLIASVRRNLYTALSLETNESVCSPYEISSFITKCSYISHHSAFDYYGMTNQVFSQIYISSYTKFNDFDFYGKHYKYIASKTDKGINTIGKVRVTDIERTIVDSIKDFSKIAGLEELFKCLAMVTHVSEERIIEYLQIYNNNFLWQKAGFILSLFPSMKISDVFFDICKNNKGKSVRYLYDNLKYENCIYMKNWGLFVPNNIMGLISETGEAIV